MLNVTFTGYRVPTNHTTYMCKVVDVPLKVKTHAIEWGAVLNSTDISAVHHSIIYGCKSDEFANLPPANTVFDCLHDTPCATTVAMWAVGGRPFTLPDNVGYPIGPGYFTKFVLQVHFTNPTARADIIDNSGIYLKLTPSPRPMDASIMLVGPVAYDYLIKIPPGMPSWTQVSTCPGACTKAVFKNESVKIIGSVLHLHTLGRQMFTDVIRGGSKVSTINRQDYYDFASQQTVPTLPEFELLPGDELRTTCVWDSSTRTKVTMGGPSTEEEMCIDYLVYYPARQGQEMNSCFDFCVDSTTFATDPTSPNLATFYLCGTGDSSIIPSNKKCTIDYGANVPLSTLNGCPAQTQVSLANIPSETLSAPATALSPPAPAALAAPATPAASPPAPGTSGKAAPTSFQLVPAAIVLAVLCSFLALL
ncbi:hypothetical protein CLOM_g13942 [Closterium sp. NIES-68]|nr:hypothetical protein CLOM_g13942 [Closterium sp. NIES-68]